MNASAIAASFVGWLALGPLAGGCQKQSAPEQTPLPASVKVPPASTPPAWTPEHVRQFVVDTEELVFKQRNQALEKHIGDQASGECYGKPAYPMGKASEIVPMLETRLTGRALQCYTASYFGCRQGDSIASAGVSIEGPSAVPFFEAKVAILEQTPDRIVAEVGEAEFNMVLQGKLDPKQADGTIEHRNKSRYTLTRDPKGDWRISDRIPSFKEWECREK